MRVHPHLRRLTALVAAALLTVDLGLVACAGDGLQADDPTTSGPTGDDDRPFDDPLAGLGDLVQTEADAAWYTALDTLVRDDGSIDPTAATTAFALAFGPIDGVDVPTDGLSSPVSGTGPWRWARMAFDELGTETRAAVLAVEDAAAAAAAREATATTVASPGWSEGEVAGGDLAAATQSGPDACERAARAAVGDVEPQLERMLNRRLTLRLAYQGCTASADRAGAWATPSGFPSYDTCTVTPTRRFLQFTDQQARAAIAHELFHCMQWQIAGRFAAWGPWFAEGSAAWVGEKLVGGYPDADTWWRSWYRPGAVRLLQESYSAIGFYSELERRGVDVPAALVAALEDNLVIDPEDIGSEVSSDPDFFLDLSAGRAHRPALGPRWDVTGPSSSTGGGPQPLLDLESGARDSPEHGLLADGRIAQTGLLSISTAVFVQSAFAWEPGGEFVGGVGTRTGLLVCNVDPVPGGFPDVCSCPDGFRLTDNVRPSPGAQLVTALATFPGAVDSEATVLDYRPADRDALCCAGGHALGRMPIAGEGEYALGAQEPDSCEPEVQALSCSALAAALVDDIGVVDDQSVQDGVCIFFFDGGNNLTVVAPPSTDPSADQAALDLAEQYAQSQFQGLPPDADIRRESDVVGPWTAGEGVAVYVPISGPIGIPSYQLAVAGDGYVLTSLVQGVGDLDQDDVRALSIQAATEAVALILHGP